MKALFEALDYKWEEIKSGFSEENQKVPSYLYLPLAAGLLYFHFVFFKNRNGI